jgi:hypothetical protein
MHVHLREPGHEHRDGLEGSRLGRIYRGVRDAQYRPGK